MNCGVTVAVFLAVTVSFVLSDPVHQRTEGRYQCAGYCKGRTKFRYVPRTTYVYNYTANTLTSVRGATKEKSQLRLSATASFHVVSECDFVLQLENVQLADFDLKNDEIHSSVARSAQFAAALQKNPLHFSFQDGTVDELCPGDDPAWVLNIKRGILSAFQNTMHDLSSAREKRHETDISGICETKYDVMLEEDEVNKPLLLIGKNKNLLACSHRLEHFLSLQSTPYTSPSGAQSLPLIKSQQRGHQVIGDGILQKATNNEIHTFRPFSNHDSGAVTMVHQMLVYRTSHSGGTPQAFDEVPKRRTNLLYEHVDATNDKMDHEYTVMELLKELVLKTHHGVESDVPSVFSHLVAVLTSMNYNKLEKVFSDATDKQTRKFLLDAMPLVRTADGIAVMIRLFNSHEITSAQMDSWLTSLAFQTKPTLEILSSVLPLLNGSPSASALLGTSALVHNYCQQNRNCQDMDQVQEIMRNFEGFLGSGCQSSDQAKQQLVILALKAIGNAGIFTESTDTLRKCIQAVNPIDVRLAAISAYRRLPCTESDQSHFLNLYTNKHEDTELRIAAYLAIMQCPSPHVIRNIKDTLYSEDVNQVASFVWTHLTNLQETSSVWKQHVRALLSNDFLQNKFKTDVRKFSRNYEGSFFSESLNVGAAAESNVIFTPQSYLPRSAMLNLTLDLFGESVNILEFGARAEGFENIVENMFGPEGYFPDSAMNKILKKLKDKGESDNVENSISQLADQFNAKGKLEKEPSASVYTRVFGNELHYTQLHGLKEMLHTIHDASYFSVFKKIMQERDIDFTKSLVLIDGSYIIPTCVGFPLNLALNGSATVGLKLNGYANVKDLFTLNSIDIEGSVTPSAAIEFAGTMAVDATVTKAGIRLVNRLHTNTYISGKVKIQGGDLVDLQLSVPREKIELLDVASQIFFLHHDHLVESKGITDNVENYTVCSTDFASSLIGMKPCMALTYVNSSLNPSTPYFPLTGPFRFHLDITKIDTFNVYEFIFKHQKKISAGKSGTSVIFHFDTPGSKVDRKLSAQYVLDWTNAAAKASIMTPLIKVSASGKMKNSESVTSLDALIMLNNQELITTRIGCKRSTTEHTGHYEPFFALSYRKKLIADISGKVNYVEGFNYSANFAIKGLSKEPFAVSGNFIMNENNYDMMGDIISKPLTSTFHGSLHFAENSLSAKAVVKYQTGNSKPHMLDFSAKLQDNSRGTLIREGVYVTLQMSQFPHYSADAFWEVQHSNHYFESIFKLAVGNTTWQTQQLYHYQSDKDDTHLAILCTLACQQLGVNYGVDVLYQVANATISSHFKTTITPQYKLLASLNYSHGLEDKMHQHELDMELSSPWYKIGIHGTLAESSPSRHEIQLSSWWGTQTDVRRVNVSGFYLDESNKLKVDHRLYITLAGELRGKLVAGLTSSSNFKNQWIKLDVYNKTYLANVTYIKDIFHFLEGTVQFAESTYGGSLVLLNTSTEKGLAVDLKLRKRLTLAAKVTCDDENHGLHFELFWDKDENPKKKISLVAEAVGNKKEVLLEIPGRYLKGEIVTVATGVTGFIEWEEHRKVTVQLEWNLDKAYADITARLHTPFPWMRSLSLVSTYSLLESDGVFLVQTSWQEEKLNLTLSVRRLSTVSKLWGWKVEAHLESTVPAIAHVSFELEFKSCTENQLTIQTFALLNYNTKQSSVEANWTSDKSSFLGDVRFNTPIQYLESVNCTLTFTDNSTETAGSLEMDWSLENKIVAEFVIKKVDRAAGGFRIATPFSGYEITSAEYSFTDFQGGNGTTYVRMEANAVFREYVAMFDISGLKTNSSLGGILHLKTPFTDEVKIVVFHQLESGKLNETFLVSLAEEKLLFVYLVGEVHSFTNMQLSAGIQMPNQNMNVNIGNHLIPGSLQFNCRGKWNNNNINIIAAGSYENAENILSLHFDMTANSSLLLKNVKLAFDHRSYSGTIQTSLHLPGDIRLTNTLIISDSLNWKNRLNFTTPRNTGSIENKQTFVDGVKLEHEIVANLCGQQASGLFTLVRDSRSIVIREARAVVIVPWTDPITILYKLPIDNSNIRPSLVIQFKHSQEIRFETDLQYQFGESRLNMEITSPFCEPVVLNASYSFVEGNWMGLILTKWGRKKANIGCNLKFYSDLVKVSGEFFVRHSDLGGDIAGGSFGYNLMDPEITAHALGTYRDKKMGFGLSLMLVKNVYKGSLVVQTPFRNWENLSLSGELNMAKPTKLAVMTLSKNLEDITLSGLLSADIHSSNFSMTLTSHIFGFHSISVYGSYDVSNSNNHAIELACDSNGKKVEILGKLRFDNDSFLNPVMAEINLKTPFKGYETLLAHYSCSTRGSEMNIDLQLIKSSWKFIIQSECSFNSEKGNGKVRMELPFDNLKELSLSLRYGYRPSTLERTVSIAITRNQLAVEMTGTLLITEDGSLTAGVIVKAPENGYKQLKCNVSSAKNEQQKSITLTFSNGNEDYMVTGTFVLDTEARLVIVTPLKGYENIESRIGYSRSGDEGVNSNITIKVYGYLAVPTGKSELNIHLNLQEMNSFISAKIVSPFLMTPHVEIKGEYDLRMFPASLHFQVNINGDKFMRMQITLERSSLFGEIITPINGFRDVSLFGSFRTDEKEKQTNLKVKVGKHSFKLLSTIVFGVLASEIQAELLTTLPGIERLTLHGQYNFLHNEKTAELTLTVDPSNIYELFMSGKADSMTGHAEFRMSTPVPKFKSLLFVAKYDLLYDYNVDLLVEKNGVQNNFGGHVTFTDDGTRIRFETPFKHAEDILLYITYQTGNNGRSANLTVVRNGHWTILDSSFKFKNSIAVINISTPYESVRELIITLDLSGMSVNGKESSVSVSVFRNFQHLLKASSHIFIGWNKEINAQFELSSPLLPNNSNNLSCKLYFIPVFPPSKIQVIIMKNSLTVVDFRSDFNAKFWGFTYDLMLTTEHGKQFSSIYFSPGEKFVKFNFDLKRADTLDQYIGDFRINKANGTLSAIFTSPTVGYEMFSFQWKQGYDFVHTELITPFKGYENHTVAAHFDVRHINKSAKLCFGRNKDVIDFRTSVEHGDSTDILNLHIVTPFIMFKKFDLHTQYMKTETKQTVGLNVTANNHQFEICGELFSEGNTFETKLDVSSSLQALEKINAIFFYNVTESVALGGKLNIGNMSANISSTTDFDFLRGELSGAIKRSGQITDHRIMWRLENALKTAKIIVSHGYELNFVIDAILNISSLKNVQAQVSYIKPTHVNQLYPYTSTYKLQWNIRNIRSLNGGLFLMLHNVPICNLNFNMDFDNATEIKILSADYVGFFNNYGIHLTYQIMNNSGIELTSEINLAGTEILTSLNFKPYKSKFTAKWGKVHFVLKYDAVTEYKTLDFEYRVSHYLYSLSSNLTLHKFYLPSMSFTLKTPIRHYSFLHASNQYNINTTHKGFKILLQKEHRSGEISFSVWKIRSNVGLEGNMSLPVEYFTSWYGIANLDMTSGFAGNVYCSQNFTEHLAVNFKYAPDTLKANINTPFTGLQTVKFEFLLLREYIMAVLFSVDWGEKRFLLNGTADFSNGSKPEFIIFCHSPWTDPFTLLGKYDNKETSAVSVILQMGTKVTKLEGQIKYFMKDLKFDMDFLSEFNGNQVTAKAGYDFEHPTKRTYLEARFLSLNLLINGSLSSGGMEGRLLMKTPFRSFCEIAADGILNFGQAATLKLIWNDEIYTLHGEYERKPGQFNCQFTVVTPYIEFEDIRFDIRYDHKSASAILQSPSEVLYLDCSYNFQTYAYSIGATLKVPSVTLLKHLSFTVSVDAANLTTSAIGQWTENQAVNISASLLPSNHFIKVETPFEGFEKIVASGSIKNEDTHLAVVGMLDVGSDNVVYVHHITGEGFMQHSLIISIPTYYKMNFSVNVQFEDPRNMYTKLTFVGKSTEKAVSAEGMLNLKDMFLKLSVHHPLLEAGLTCKTLLNVNASLQIRTNSSMYKMEGSYALSSNDIAIKWSTQTPGLESSTLLGGSYQYDRSELKTKLYFNEDIFTSYYKINKTSLAANFKFNSPALLKIKDFTLDIEGSHSPNLYGLVSYKCTTSSAGVAILLSNTEETATAQVTVHVQPLLGHLNHTVQITYNVNDPQNFFVCEYEGKTIHKVWMSYENNGSIFKVTADTSSSILGTRRALMFMKRNWEMAHLDVMNVFIVTLKAKENEGYLVVSACDMKHEALYHFTFENGFLGNLAFESPLISSGKVNVTAAVRSEIKNMSVDLKWFMGVDNYQATFQLDSTEERTAIKAEIIALLETILSLNAYIVINRYTIQSEMSLTFLETVNYLKLRHKRELPLDTEFNIMTPFLPKEIIRVILNTDNNSLILYGSHGDESYGEYIVLEGTINHNESLAFLNFKAPKLPLVQYIGIHGIIRLGDEGRYDLGLSTQFSSENFQSEFSAKFSYSSIGIDTYIEFLPPWKDGERYGATIVIPFMLSNSMRPQISINLGYNNTYSLHGTFINLNDVKQFGFGGQYKLRKLGGELKIENSPIPGTHVEIDIPLGDNTGHYAVGIKGHKGKNLLGIENMLNYTHIGVEWNGKQVEVRYSLSYTGTDGNNLLDFDKNLQCTLVLELTTPFYSYEQSGLKMYVSLSSSQKLIVTTINYPGNSKPFGFEFNYQLKSYKDITLVSQLHIPFFSALEDVALVLSNKFEEKHGTFKSAVVGHWNKEELAITLYGSSKEEIVFKGTVTLKLIGQTYALEANYGSPKRDMLGPYVLRAGLTSPFEVLNNAEVYMEINLMKSVLANITQNSKELLCFHIYSDEVTLLGLQMRSPRRSAYFVGSYDIEKDITIHAELSLESSPLSKLQFGIIFALSYGPDDRREMSASLKLPSRVLMFNLTNHVSPVHIEHACSFSWKKDQIIGFKTIFNVTNSSNDSALSVVGHIDLPHRSFELGSYARTRFMDDTMKYVDIGTEFLWDALEDKNKKIGIAFRRYSTGVEMILQHALMRNDLVIRIIKHGRLLYEHLPFTVRIEVEYSALPEELITMEAHVQYPTNTAVGINVGFSLCHIPTSTDFKIALEVVQTAKESTARLSAEHLNSYTGQKHRIEVMGKMNMLQPEVKLAMRTAENQLEVHGLLKTGKNGHYGALVELLMNQKEPLSVEASVHLAEARVELEARYGNIRSYKMYAVVPHCREIAMGVKHVFYETEYEDIGIMLRLNTSQQLWSKIKWQPQALTKLKTGFLQEYSDITHVVQSISIGYSEALLKDFTYKYNTVYPVLVDMVDHTVSASVTEVSEIYKDFLDMVEEMRNMYRRNDFYLQDILPHVSKFVSYVTGKASGVCQVLMDRMESMYMTVKNFVVMTANTFQIDFSHIFHILYDIKVVASKTGMYIANFTNEVKRLHSASKEYLKSKIEAARLGIMQAEENMKHLLTYIEDYLADLLTSYIQFVEPYLTRIENTMELLGHRVIDFEDKISEYIFDMVDTVLGAEKVKELAAMYSKYSSWLEEFHLQDYIDQATKFFESISKLVMQDIHRVFSDYLEYMDYIIDAMNNMYRNINAMPLVAYTKHTMNIIEEKAKWLWQYYKLSEHIKVQLHSWIENLDKILLRLLNAIDMDIRSPTKSLTQSITLHPDIGLIEYSQKLPIEWNGFNELPKFEQLHWYEQAKDHANEIASLDKYRYYLMDTFYDITNNISLASVLPPFSAYGMVIGKYHYITFDKKFYSFTGMQDCSYLLANDFLTSKFSVFVTYKTENREIVKKSLTILIEGHHIVISSDKQVTIDGRRVELPVAVGIQTWIKPNGERVVVHSELGIEVECNLHYDICAIELSGWYFGKTGGMLGTFDYEPSNDLSLPNGTAAHTLEAFADSWRVGSARFQPMTSPAIHRYSPSFEEFQTSDRNPCTVYFEDQASPLHRCFSQVETGPFYEMCLSEHPSSTGVCTSVAAYVSQCRRTNVDVWMPQTCVHCPTLNGSTINVNEQEVYVGVEAMLADVVFVVEESPCIKEVNLAELVSKLDASLKLQGLNTHFSVVGFNGKKFSEPHTHTSSGETWATVQGTQKALRSLQSGILNSSSSGNQRTFSALWHASRLPFRATASKTIVLLQCPLCQETEDEYSNMISMLLENDITLHMLQPLALRMHLGQNKASKVYGVDLHGAFSGHNLKSLMPSLPVLKQITLPKDMCTPLALETNGTLFNLHHLLHNVSGKHRLTVKKFIDVWARRVTLTAKPSPCQKCRCVANQDGVGQIMCSKCLSPSTEHFLKEWGDLNKDNKRTWARLPDDI